MRAAGLDGEPRDGQTDCGALLLDDAAQPVGVLEDVHRVVGGGVGDALAAAEVELGQLDAVLVADRGEQPDHPVRGELEAVDVEDVRADVAVQPDQLERRQREHPADRLGRRAAGQREAELLVLLAGLDVLVGVRLDAGRHPDVDPLAHAGALGDGGQPLELVEGVDDDAADADARRRARARRRSCCCRGRAAARRGSRRAARRRARRRCRRRATGPPRRPSGRRPCTGTPCRRSRRRRRRTRRARRGSGRGSRPRRGRRPGCRTRAARSRTSTPPSSGRPSAARAGGRAARPTGSRSVRRAAARVTSAPGR